MENGNLTAWEVKTETAIVAAIEPEFKLKQQRSQLTNQTIQRIVENVERKKACKSPANQSQRGKNPKVSEVQVQSF